MADLRSVEVLKPRGFAALSPERRQEISRMGGAAVSPENRWYSRNPERAAKAGRKGGLQPKRRASFITIAQDGSGWRAVHMGWNVKRAFWEPLTASSSSYVERGDAEREGKEWAAFESVEFRA